MELNSPDQHRKSTQLKKTPRDYYVTIVSRVIRNTYTIQVSLQQFSAVHRDTRSVLTITFTPAYFQLPHKQTSIIRFLPTVCYFHFIAMFHLIFFHSPR